MPAPLVMQSSGGVLDVGAAAEQAAGCVLSGPAGGVVGAAHVARASGFDDVLTFDMGGTSTDVAPILGGEASTTTESVIAGVPVKLPMVDVHTVSAGGGSIAWADPGGALRVGPRSAGADPGPAAYGKGGEEPTVTDANVAARLPRRRRGARRRADAVARRGRGGAGAARLATSASTRSRPRSASCAWPTPRWPARCGCISVERGLDPREFALRRVRRRRRRCTPARWPRSSACRRCSCRARAAC